MTTMTTRTAEQDTNEVFYVVHPLDDAPEIKHTGEGLGPIQMTKTVRYSLIALRGYLILVMLLALYRMLTLAGCFGHLG